MQVEEVLQRTSVAKLKHRVVVRLGFDHLFKMDHVWAVDCAQEDNFASKGEHALFPVIGVVLSGFVDPLTRSDLACKLLIFHPEEPNLGLHALPKLLFEHIVLALVLDRCDSFEPCRVDRLLGATFRHCVRVVTH